MNVYLFFEKIDIFENFENFRFWNFLKNFWILRHSKIHNMIWKISWYDIIIMFYYITSISDINYRLIWGRNMKIYHSVDICTPRYGLGFKGLNGSDDISFKDFTTLIYHDISGIYIDNNDISKWYLNIQYHRYISMNICPAVYLEYHIIYISVIYHWYIN